MGRRAVDYIPLWYHSIYFYYIYISPLQPTRLPSQILYLYIYIYIYIIHITYSVSDAVRNPQESLISELSLLSGECWCVFTKPSRIWYNKHPSCPQIKPVRLRRSVSKGFQLYVFEHTCKRVQVELGVHVVYTYTVYNNII